MITRKVPPPFFSRLSSLEKKGLISRHMYSKPPKQIPYTFLTLFAKRPEEVFSCLSLFMRKGLRVYFHEPELRRYRPAWKYKDPGAMVIVQKLNI